MNKANIVLIFIALLASSLAIIGSPANAANADDENIVVTLLGTGTPQLSATRFGPSTLVQAGGLNLVFDAGRGASIRMAQSGISPGQISALFVTHLHSDHINGFPDLWMAGYRPHPEGRTGPLKIFGPMGTKQLGDNVMSAFQADSDLRGRGGRIPENAEKIETLEIGNDGVVFDEAGVRVTAFRVSHVESSFGYRVDYNGKSVLMSGDTSFDRNLIAHGQGVDLLVHQVRMRPPGADNGIHTSPEDAGRVFAQTGTKAAVYSHIILGPGNRSDEEKILELEARTRANYDGPLFVGEDLLRFDIGDEVRVDSSLLSR